MGDTLYYDHSRNTEKGATMFKSYSKKQAGVIFSNVKRGNLYMSENDINEMYFFADWATCNATDKERDMCQAIRDAVTAVFDGNMGEAQKMVDRFAMIRGMIYA